MRLHSNQDAGKIFDGLAESLRGIFDQGDTLTVDVQYPYSYLVLPGFVAGLADYTLGATTVMLAE